VKASILREATAGCTRRCVPDVDFDRPGSVLRPVQRGWSPIGEPHRVFPQPHCKRSVPGARDFGVNLLTYHISKTTIKRPDVVQFLEQIARESTPRSDDGSGTRQHLDPSQHRQETIDRWFPEYRMVLFYLPPYSSGLNLIEIWKHARYHWRRFVTRTRETIDAEIEKLVDGLSSYFQIRFS
jgi:transposase